MISLSNSTLRLFLECPRCFWLQKNKKISRPRGIFPTLPTGMDSVIKEYFNRYRRMGTLPPLIANKISGKLAEISLNLSYVDAELDLKITGRLDDCLQIEDNFLVPLDHKTRASLPGNPEYSQNYYQTQMDTYTLLLQKNQHPIKNLAYIVYYSPLPGELHNGIPFAVEVHEIQTYPDRVYEFYKNAKICLESEIPGPSESCEFCRWKALADRF